jgi:hypothetical protein
MRHIFALCLLAASVAAAQQQVPDTCQRILPAPSVRLLSGDSAVRTIVAREKRNATHVFLEKGGVYDFVARGLWQDGDHIRPVTGSGFTLRDVPWLGRGPLWIAHFFRAVGGNWFLLVGEVAGTSKQVFAIGDSLKNWTAPDSGEFSAFANDVAHWSNNKNCLDLTIRRVR